MDLLNEHDIHAALAKVSDELQRVEARKDTLLAARKGLEALLDLVSSTDAVSQWQPLFHLPADPSRRPNQPKGTTSLRGAVLRVVKEAGGEPLHAMDIYRRAAMLGAATSSPNPIAIVDLMMYSLRKSAVPVEKVRPRTWRWIGD